MLEEMTKWNIKYLKQHGPIPTDELPVETTPAQRKEGLVMFKILAGQGATQALGGPVTRVAYLQDKHEPDEVLNAFFEQNLSLVDKKDPNGIVRLVGNNGKRWREAAAQILREYRDLSFNDQDIPGVEEGSTKDCPLCGTEVSKGKLPAHLPKCPET